MLKKPDGSDYTFDISLVFVGPSGAGKSRLLKTIYRWYENVGVHIKTKNITPGFDCMVRSLDDECMRCSRDKNMTQGCTSKERGEELDAVFERVGGTYNMEMPTSWFASYVWPTFNERHNTNNRSQGGGDENERRKKEIFNKGTLTVRMSENDDDDDDDNENDDAVLQMVDSKKRCRHLVVVHLISLDKIEFDSSLSYFARSVDTVSHPPKTESEHTRNYRCVAYTKADSYRDGETLPSMESIISDARASSKAGVLGGVNVVDILEKSKFFKFVSCADDVSAYDRSFGSLRFFFDLMGKLLQLDINNHYNERQRLEDYLKRTTAVDSPAVKNIGDEDKMIRNVRNIKDEGCCYQ